MSIYPVVLFLHIVGANGYFVGMGIWLFGLSAMRQAQHVEQVRTLAHLVGLTGPLFGISVLVLLAAGVYMALTAWSLLLSQRRRTPRQGMVDQRVRDKEPIG